MSMFRRKNEPSPLHFTEVVKSLIELSSEAKDAGNPEEQKKIQDLNSFFEEQRGKKRHKTFVKVTEKNVANISLLMDLVKEVVNKKAVNYEESAITGIRSSLANCKSSIDHYVKQQSYGFRFDHMLSKVKFMNKLADFAEWIDSKILGNKPKPR